MRRSGTSGLHDKSPGEWRGHPGPREWKHMTAGFKSMTGRRILPALILLICMISLLHRMRDQARNSASQKSTPDLHAERELISSRVLYKATDYHHASTVDLEEKRVPDTRKIANCSYFTLVYLCPHYGLMAILQAGGVHVPQDLQTVAPRGSNGYLVVRCNGGLNQQRTAICNAVLAARIMNATLVLPHLDTNSFWHDESGFPGIYDVEHFIDSLKSDVRVIHTLPATWAIGTKRMKLKPYQLQPPRDAPVRWYETTALETMKKHGAVYLTPFSHRLDEKLDNHEYQRLRCRVNYHALRFNNDIRNLSSIIVQRLRSVGPYMAIHLRFELDMLAFAGCLDIFTPEEQEILKKYRKENFAEKKLEYNHRRLIGKCPLTPHEVGLFLRAMGFNNATRIYLAVGEVFGGERFLKPLRDLFPQLETRSTVALPEELGLVRADGHGLLGPAVDYMVCLLSDIFVPTYDGPSNFANNLIGQRLYYGFRTTLQPDRKALAPHYIKLEKGLVSRSDFETSVRQIMSPKSFGRPRTRLPSESFYTNPWPECFCMISSKDSANQCPLDIVETTSVDIDEDENFLDEWNQLQRL